MKTIYRFLLCSIMLAICAGCEKGEEISEDFQYELKARMENSVDTKTSLSEIRGGIYFPLWSQGDEIAVFPNGIVNPVKFRLQSGEGTTEAIFSGNEDVKDVVALYPYNESAVIRDGGIVFTLPAKQQYVKGSFGQGCYPMVAEGSNGILEFKNLCSVLKISLYGKGTVKNITLKANDEKTYISGSVTVPTSYSTAPQLEMSSTGSNTVTLECNGVELTNENATDFYVVIPAQTYRGGLTLSIEAENGNMEKSISKDLTFDRSQIRELEGFEFKVDDDIETSESLQGEGTLASPFQIKSLSDLLLMQQAVNSQAGKIISASTANEVDARSAHYRLMADIDLSAVCGQGKENWIPIGNYSENKEYLFGGVFDGDGHTVKGLYILSNKEYQGLFGYLKGVIKNLSVDGVVAGQGLCGLVCGRMITNAEIVNCTAFGRVESNVKGYSTQAYYGGIVGRGYNIYNCTNYADVNNGYNSGIIGGIAGASDDKINNSKNYGNIINTGKYGYAGGIVGDGLVGNIFNSSNKGKVSAINIAGGIAGYNSGMYTYNCSNWGEVVSSGILGGIVGVSGKNGERPRIKNCVNVGVLKSNSGTVLMGAICGENADEVDVTNCYWLFDKELNIGIEEGLGKSDETASIEKVFALTAAQMRGEEDCNEALYISPKSVSYYNILDALNVFAYYNTSYKTELYGWEQDKDTGYPVLNGSKPGIPDKETDRIFEVSVKEISVPYNESTIEVTVKANMDYSIVSMPDWITEITTKAVGGEGKTIVHKFKVAENKGSEARTGVIEFCNEEQSRIQVTVNQAYKVPVKFEISQTEIELGAEKSTFELTITSSIGYQVKPEVNWIRQTAASGSNGVYTHTFEVAENTSTTAREGVIVVCNDDQMCIPVLVKQKGDMSWVDGTFYHRSLAMHFLNVNSADSHEITVNLNEFENMNPDKIEPVALHCEGALEFSKVSDLISSYGIDEYPIGIIDSRETFYSASSIKRELEYLEQNCYTQTGISYTSKLTGNVLDLDLNIYIKAAGNYKVTVLLLQDRVFGAPQLKPDGSRQNYAHYNVVRMALTDVLGDDCSTTEHNQIVNKKFNVSIPSEYDKGNMRILVYVQRPYESQPDMEGKRYGSYYVDNCVSGKLGADMQLVLCKNISGGGNEDIIPKEDIGF